MKGAWFQHGRLGGGSPEATARGRSFRRGLVMGVVIGLLCGWAVFRLSGATTATAGGDRPVSIPAEIPDSPATPENFARIAPGADAWQVDRWLGPGRLVGEQGMEVDEHGKFRKWESLGRVGSVSEGILPDHDGRAFEDVRATYRWTNGGRSFFVVFHNGKVAETWQESL